jgi:MoxR-like ATPase
MNYTNTMVIGQKTALTGYPYIPKVDLHSDIVDRMSEMRDITAAWMAGPNTLPMSPLLLGAPGVGKNRIVYELARMTGKDLFIFQGHEDVTAEDLACAVRFSDDPGKKMDYVLSPLVTAMATGQICFIDEIAKIRPRALALLVSVLDERRYIDSTLLGERIYAKDGFRFIAATNTADLIGNTLPDFIGQRLRPVIQVDYPSAAVIDLIIKNQFPFLGDTVSTLTDHFWQLWHNQNSETPPSPRDAIQIFNFTIGLSRFEDQYEEEGFKTSGTDQAISLHTDREEAFVSIAQLECAFNVFFSRPVGGQNE